MSGSLLPASTVPSNSGLSAPSMVLMTRKSASTVDFELSRITVTTSTSPSSTQSADSVAVGLNDFEGGESPLHASSLRVPPVGVKASF